MNMGKSHYWSPTYCPISKLVLNDALLLENLSSMTETRQNDMYSSWNPALRHYSSLGREIKLHNDDLYSIHHWGMIKQLYETFSSNFPLFKGWGPTIEVSGWDQWCNFLKKIFTLRNIRTYAFLTSSRFKGPDAFNPSASLSEVIFASDLSDSVEESESYSSWNRCLQSLEDL